VQVGKSESGDSVAVDRDGVVRGSVVGRVDSALITYCKRTSVYPGAT